MQRTCKKCGVEKPLEQFEKNKLCREGRTHRCSECAAAVCRKWKAKNQDYMRRYHRKYYLESKEPGFVLRRAQRVETVESLALRKERQREWSRQGHLKRHYGMKKAEWDAMVLAQDGKCAICLGTNDKTGRGLYVDHDHATGKIRELLCHWCNTSIGRMQDSPELLEAAAAYLRRHRDG